MVSLKSNDRSLCCRPRLIQCLRSDQAQKLGRLKNGRGEMRAVNRRVVDNADRWQLDRVSFRPSRHSMGATTRTPDVINVFGRGIACCLRYVGGDHTEDGRHNIPLQCAGQMNSHFCLSEFTLSRIHPSSRTFRWAIMRVRSWLVSTLDSTFWDT